MSLATAIATRLQVVIASKTVIDLTNQRDADSSVDSTLLAAVAEESAKAVRRQLGQSVDDTDDDAVDFGVRIAVLRLTVDYSLTMTQDGATYTAGVYSEMRREAEARRQAQTSLDIAEEDYSTHDARFNAETWDGED